MMRRRLVEIGFSCAVAAVFLWSASASLSWSVKAGLFPATIGVSFFLLTLWHISCLLRATQSVNPAGAKGDQSSSMEANDRGALESGNALVMVGWLGGYFIVIVGLGFELASVAFFLLFMKIFGREKWWVTLVCAILGWMLVKIFFVEFLHVPFPRGWLIHEVFR